MTEKVTVDPGLTCTIRQVVHCMKVAVITWYIYIYFNMFFLVGDAKVLIVTKQYITTVF